jgi:clan AA aspartic protease (TIGR02281 family)
MCIRIALILWFSGISCLLNAQHITHLHVLDSVLFKIKQNEYNQALALLAIDSLYSDNNEAALLNTRINLLLYKKDWQGILKIARQYPTAFGADSSIINIARLNSQFPMTQYKADSKVSIPYKSNFETPIIKVSIKGKQYKFLLDTGAGLTVLSQSTADQCQVFSNSNYHAKAMAATGQQVGFKPANIPAVNIGGLTISNLPCMILADRDLTFRLAGIKIWKIDGIIGWNVLQELAVTINPITKKIELEIASATATPNHQFCWLEQPLVLCNDSSSHPCYFLFDSGAGQSGLYDNYLTLIDTSTIQHKQIKIGSAGGFKRIQTSILPLVNIKVGNQNLRIKNAIVFPKMSDSLLPVYGVIGMKELRHQIIHFNSKAGEFYWHNK